MTITATLTQISMTTILCEWVTDEPDPVARWDFGRLAPLLPGEVTLAYYYNPPARAFAYYLDPDLFDMQPGDLIQVQVKDQTTSEFAQPSALWKASLEAPGIIDPLITAPRYTTMERVKGRLRIPDSTDTWDDRITAAIVSGEYAIDVELGQSFPNPTVDGIPVALGEAATNVAVRLYKAGDAPAGVAGSDDMFGALDLTEQVRAEIGRSPILRGFKVSWGVS